MQSPPLDKVSKPNTALVQLHNSPVPVGPGSDFGNRLWIQEIRVGANLLNNLDLGKLSLACLPRCLQSTRSRSPLIDCISVGVDRMQRNFEPMRKQVEAWQRSELTDVTAKVVIYEAFVEGKTGNAETSRPHGA